VIRAPQHRAGVEMTWRRRHQVAGAAPGIQGVQFSVSGVSWSSCVAERAS
jgi:hypothetical protein